MGREQGAGSRKLGVASGPAARGMMRFNFRNEAQSQDEESDGARRESAADSGRGAGGADPAAADDSVCGGAR